MRQFAVIGLGRFGFSVAKTLSDKAHQVIAIDINEELVQEASEFVTEAVQADATDEKALRAIGIANVDVAIVGIGTNLEASILVTQILREIGISEIVARAVTETHGKVLRRVGATKVVFLERDMGSRVANSLISPQILEQIDLSPEYSILETIPLKEFIGRSIRDIDVRAKYELNIIAIKRRENIVDKEGDTQTEESLNIAPKADYVIKEGDILIILGSNENLERLKQEE